MARYVQLATEVDLISWVVESAEHADIAFLSILFGLVENRLLRDQAMEIWKVLLNSISNCDHLQSQHQLLIRVQSQDEVDCWDLHYFDASPAVTPGFDFSPAEVVHASALCAQFGALCRRIDLPDGLVVTRANIKAVADFVWSQLSTSVNKDRLHIASLLGLLEADKPKRHLDCFGVSVAVLAACQIMGILNENLTLALSEDHAFLIFRDATDATGAWCSAEVTWYGVR